MYRVLHIMAGADAGGISTVVLNYYRFLDREKIHFDIALTSDRDGQNGRLLRQLGAEFFRLPLKSAGLRAFDAALTELLRRGQYDAIHVHENETSYVALAIAKREGVPHRFAHSHTSSPYVSGKSELKRLSGCLLNAWYATRLIACGQLAGERVFGKRAMAGSKALVLPNAVDADAFAFDAQVRSRMRSSLGLEGKLAIGMVGRLSPEKNHAWALEWMAKLRRQRPDAVLLIVGNGEEEPDIRNRIARLGLEDCVTLLGRRPDVPRLCQALDVLIMPSHHEGFPVTAVEAMASGLPVLLSDTITRELAFGSGVRYLPLGEPDRWIRALEELPASDRGCGIREVKDHGLDLRSSAGLLERLYLSKEM